MDAYSVEERATSSVFAIYAKYVLVCCFVYRPGQQFFSNNGTALPLPWFLPVLWGALSVLLKEATRRSWGSNPGPLAPESADLPLSLRAFVC